MQTATAHHEIYQGYGIDLSVRRSEDGTFSAYGMIRHAVKRLPPGRDLPFECSFDTKERHPTEEAAMESGVAWAKNRISMSAEQNMYAMDEEELAAFVAQQEHTVAKLNYQKPGSGEYRMEESILKDAKQLLTDKRKQKKLFGEVEF
jgi:hypothetical protein